MNAPAAFWLTLCLPALAWRAAGLTRRSLDARTGPALRLVGEATIGACWIAVLPWLALVVAAVTVFVRAQAARADREQRVSRWDERHHDSAGDPAAWSGT